MMGGGLHNSEFIVLAARTSVGKTTLAMNFVRNIAVMQQIPTLVISLESRSDELYERATCAHAGVDSDWFRRGKLPDWALTKFRDASEEVSNRPIWTDDAPVQKMGRIASTARRFRRNHGIRFVVVDYGGLVEADNKNARRHEQVADLTRRLKMLARELDFPVLGIAQVNRGPENRADDRPKLSDLRESGTWEQDADAVLLLHRPEDEITNRPHETEITVIIAKQRHGPTGDLTLHYDRPTGRFFNLGRE